MQKFSRFLVAALLFTGAVQAQQAALLDEVHTVAAPGAAVPAEFPVSITTAGTYEVVLTDLGAPTAALASVRMAVTQGATLVGTPLSAPGTLAFSATASTNYVVRVTGAPGAGIGSGLVRVDVRAAGNTTPVNTFVAALAPPEGEPSADQFVLDTPLTVTATGDYDVTLRDLIFPQALPTLLLAVVEEGGPLVTALNISTGNPAAQRVTLDATRRYHVFSIAVPPSATAGGLYSIDVSSSGGSSALNRTVPVGGVALLGSATLATGDHTLKLRDLAFPTALTTAMAAVVKSGVKVVQKLTTGDVGFTAAAGAHEVFAYGVVANSALAGSLVAELVPPGQSAALFSAAHVFAATDGTVAFTYDTNIANAASFRVRLADYQFPVAFTALRLAAVQNGAVVGTPISGAGNFDINAAQGKLILLTVARAGAGGSLLGVDVTPTALGAVAFETTQGVGGTFVSRKLTVATSKSFDVRVSDLAFPAAFANVSTAVTRGSDRIGLVFGGGTFHFDATPGNYFLNLIAVPNATQNAGTYAVSVTERPPPPVVTFTATPGSVTGSGAVDLTWSTQSATACTASGGWTGAKAVSGTERSASISAQTVFTLACTGPGGSTSKDVTVTVTPATQDPPKGGGGGGAFEAIWLVLLGACLGLSLLLRNGGRAAPLLAALVALLALGGCGGAQSRYARSMERGNEYLEAGDLDKARVEFRNATQIAPQAAEARYFTGVVAQRRGDFREALLSYKAAMDARADYPEAQAAQARIYLLAGATDKALEMVAPGLGRHPDHAGLLVARGTAYVQIKQPIEARADAEHALKTDPANEGAAALLASLLRAAGETDKAIALLESTLKHAPESVDLRRVLSTMQVESGDLAGAEAQLVKLVKMRPEEMALRYELANFYLRRQNLDASQKTLEEGVAALPKSDEARLALANFLATHRSREVGEQKLRAMIQADPDNLELRNGLAALLERNGADQAAVTAYQDIIDREPNSPNAVTARNRLAAYYSSHGDVPRAQALIAEVIKTNPRDVDALGLRARLAIDQGNASAAVVDLRTVLRDMPNSPEVYRMLARAHLANGEPALAEEALRKSLEQSPADAASRLELAQLLIRSGRADTAVTMLEDAVRRSPNDVQLRDAMVRAYIETRDLAAAARAAEDLQVLLPKSPMGFYYRGQVALLQKDPAGAEQQFAKALAVEPNAIDALAALSKLQVAAGRGDEAIARVEAMLSSGVDAPALRNLHGELLLATRQLPKAAQEFERVVAQSPQWWLAYRNLAVARYSQQDAAGAIRAYESGIKAVPEEINLVVDLAALYELQKRVDDAARVYENYLAAHSGEAHSGKEFTGRQTASQELASNNLAKLLLAHKDDAASLARVSRLVEPFAKSRDPALLDTYGWSLYRHGEYARAQQVLESAFARATDSGAIRYHLALVQVKTGDIHKAIDNLEVAVMSPRGFIGIVEARSLLADLKSRAS